MKDLSRRNFQSLKLATGANVRIAVLDSGINPQFPAIGASKFRSFDCVSENRIVQITELPANVSSDRNSHGSLVQSCILAAATDASIDHYRILNADNQCDSEVLCQVLQNVIQRKYDIINLSLGTRNTARLPWLIDIIKKAYETNTIVVAACSNVGNIFYPAQFTYCISVKALNIENFLHLRFNKNSVVEFSAKGVHIEIPGPDGRPILTSGSSFAAGYVTGICARIIEIQGECQPLSAKVFLRQYAEDCELENPTAHAS